MGGGILRKRSGKYPLPRAIMHIPVQDPSIYVYICMLAFLKDLRVVHGSLFHFLFTTILLDSVGLP